jgi:hypothetical protein
MTAPAITNPIPQLQRPVFFDGQLLAAADLTAIYDYHREMRWLHNQTLHGWGIAYGFTVQGAIGDRTVTVAPGYALDCLGEEIVLGAPSVLQVPPVAGAAGGGPAVYYLTASYQTDDQLSPSETGSGSCQSEGAIRLTEAPLIRWQDPKNVSVASLRYRRGLDIVLATVSISACKIAKAISTADRRALIASSQPYITGGSTAVGGTTWKSAPPPSWILSGVTVDVDTSAAGFVTTPTYTAQVNGNRSPEAGVVIDGVASISNASATGFTVTVMLPRDLDLGGGTVLNPSALLDPTLLLPKLKSKMGLGWSVSWIGVEG